MAQHVIVDGYNVMGIKGGGSLPFGGELQRQRERFLRELRPLKMKRNLKVTVVFDGQDKKVVETTQWGLKVLFAGGEGKADLVIEKLARNMSGAVVVTSDSALAERCRKAGATVMGARELLKRIIELGSQDQLSEEEEEESPIRCSTRKKGPHRRLSRRQRRERQRLQGL